MVPDPRHSSLTSEAAVRKHSSRRDESHVPLSDRDELLGAETQSQGLSPCVTTLSDLPLPPFTAILTLGPPNTSRKGHMSPGAVPAPNQHLHR